MCINLSTNIKNIKTLENIDGDYIWQIKILYSYVLIKVFFPSKDIGFVI